MIPPGTPRLFLTSMSTGPRANEIVEMVEPILTHLDGIVWVLCDSERDSPAARYLESVKGAGAVIYRRWVPRHWHVMNETLFAGVMQEGDYVIWTDLLEHPQAAFLSRVKTEIGPMMKEADLGALFYYGKAFLFPYAETLEYRNSPHWSLHGWNGRGIEWSQIEPDESKVRFNARPAKRAGEPKHFCRHYLKYFIEYPAGSNHAALGIEQWGGDPNQAFAKREANRLAFRAEMRCRGFPLTVDGFVTMCQDPVQMDAALKTFLNSDKTFSDAYWHLVKGQGHLLRDTHRPSDALPIP